MRLTVVLVFGLFSLVSFGQTVDEQIQEVIDAAMLANPDAIGILVSVECPDKKVSFSGAAGSTTKGAQLEIAPDRSALIASNTKTFVAAATLKLSEQQYFTLDAPIHKLISGNSQKALKKAGYDTKAITVRHLLSHTSGITDYVDDDYFAFVNKDPLHDWSRDEQIALACSKPKRDEPGASFKYADVNYVLLTEVIESKADKPIHKAISNVLDFKRSAMDHTWWAVLDKKAPDVTELLHQYDADRGWDSHDMHPAWDLYGGGGLISNTHELARFFHSLMNGEVIKKQFLDEMLTPPLESSNYGLGVMIIDFDGQEAYYHGGFWGTDVMHVPAQNTTISVFTLERTQRELNAEISKKILKLLNQ